LICSEAASEEDVSSELMHEAVVTDQVLSEEVTQL